ncbi:acyl-CoA dehydrogenase family protein [Cumulibacter soli]|uniref:acyl-CoA dehydrogenase family protein n=1 Tax=Cumulibacter soli TaxID=2546344 RepID=UPI001067AD6B|nr:acyl-CoA dehydrogenase family protein [Cumulibacter soli]
MSDNTTEIRAALRAILADHSSADAVLAAEPEGWNEPLWRVLDDGGFATIAVDETIGGSGGSLADACAVLHELGRSAASIPFAEHALLAGWLLSQGGWDLPGGVLTVIDDTSGLQIEAAGAGFTLSGTANHVAWAGASTQILLAAVVDGTPTALLLSTKDVQVGGGANLAEEQRRSVAVDSITVPAERTWELPADAVEQLRLRGALSRAALIAGALERVSELTVRYTSEREQFGRPIGRFQAVQRHVVRLTEMAQQAAMATTVAALNGSDAVDFFDVASAKIVAGECASGGAAAAHQAHGAIGMTKEYELGQLSRRLWSWRDEYGHESAWARELGHRLAEAGADELWPRIAAGLLAAGPQA